MNNFVTLKTFTNEFEAEMAQVRLEDAGIIAFIAKDDCGSMEPHLQLTRGVELKVQEKDFSYAMELINKIDHDYSSSLEDLDENDEEEHAFRESIKKDKKRAKVVGRILSLLIASIFGGIALLPMKEDTSGMRYMLLGISFLFFLLFVFSFRGGFKFEVQLL